MSWKRSAVAMAIALPLIGLFTYGLRRGDPRLVPSPLIGQPAPDFALPVLALEGVGAATGTTAADPDDGLTGDTLRLSDLRGNVVVLNFFASWCVPCRIEHGALTRTALRYRGRDVRFVGVVYNDTPAAVRAYVRQLGGQAYPAVLDEGQRAAIDYGLIGVPETFFIGPDGVVRRKVFSAVTEALLVEEIEAALAGAPIEEPGE